MASHKILETAGHSFILEGGNVIIRTSYQPSGIFVVHKDVLIANSTYFEAFFSPRWDQKRRTVEHIDLKGAQTQLEVYELDLYFDFDTKQGLLTSTVSHSIH